MRPSAVVAALKKAGFVEKRQKGSHVILWHERTRRTTVVALHGWAMPKPIVKEILKQAGLTENEFFVFLRQI
jgi:predicted RNA binding protein YcfA (HicA-like mRNA interferase family)